MCGRFFLISSYSYLFKTCEFMYKIPQIAEEQLIMMMDKTQENKASKIQKLAFRCFPLTSAKAKNFKMATD